MKNKKPAIRFKGFSEEWEEKKLGDVTNLENGFAFKSEFFKDEPTNAILLTPGNVNIGGGFQEGKGRFYDMSGNFPKKFILKPEDIFVTMTDLTPTGQTLGLPAVVPYDGNIYLHNQRLGKMTGFEGDKSFLFQLLSSEQIHKQIVQTASGTTVKHSSPQRILNCLNYFPSNNEQTQIGNFFKNLDSLITLHQQKYDKLVNVKKAMLEKMFPKNGADVPEIRFKGFSGAWEKRRLGEIANFSKGQGYSKNDLVEIGSPIILYGRLYTKYQTIISEVDTFVSYRNSSILSKGNEVIVPSSGESAEDIARASAVVNSGILLGGDLNIIYPNDSVNSTFLALTISFGRPQKELAKKAQGKSVVHLRNTDLKEVDLQYPSIVEQEKIVTYFKNLDKLLTLHQGELGKLKNLKKAMLEKMFV